METIKTINKAEAEAIYFLNKVRSKVKTREFLMNLHVEEFEGEKCIVATDSIMLASVKWNREIEEGEYRIISCKKKESEIMKIEEPDFIFPQWRKIVPQNKIYSYDKGFENKSELVYIINQFGMVNLDYIKILPDTKYIHSLEIYENYRKELFVLKGKFDASMDFMILLMSRSSLKDDLEEIERIKNNSRKEK